MFCTQEVWRQYSYWRLFLQPFCTSDVRAKSSTTKRAWCLLGTEGERACSVLEEFYGCLGEGSWIVILNSIFDQLQLKLDNIAVSAFVVILVDFDKFWESETNRHVQLKHEWSILFLQMLSLAPSCSNQWTDQHHDSSRLNAGPI